MTDTKGADAAELAAAVERLTDAMVSDRPKHWMDVDDVCTLIHGFRTQAARIAELDAMLTHRSDEAQDAERMLLARIAELEAERAGMVAAERERIVSMQADGIAELIRQQERERCAKQLDALGCDHCAAAALDTEAKP